MLSGPLPVSATQATINAPIIVTFDQQLVPGTSAKVNWSGVSKPDGQPRLFNVPTLTAPIVGNTVTVTPKNTIISGLSARISYSKTVADVRSLASGIAAEPFTNFPIT